MVLAATREEKSGHPGLKAPAALPPAVCLALADADGLSAAQAATRDLAHHHYENFSVVSFLLPRRLRQDFCNVYAFCRVADDLGDEIGDPARSSQMLAELKVQTRDCFAGSARAAVFVALSQTIARHALPIEPFLDLIDAFEQDQRVFRYGTFDELADYCTRSANPVGRLVLYLTGHRDPSRLALSDKTCTALQLANFWQGVRGDLLERNRIYLPQDSMRRFGVAESDLRDGRCTDGYRALIRHEVDRAAALFDEGRALLPLLDRSTRPQISLFGQGGMAILDAIRRQNYDTLSARPSLSKAVKCRLALTALFHAACRRVLPGGSR